MENTYLEQIGPCRSPLIHVSWPGLASLICCSFKTQQLCRLLGHILLVQRKPYIWYTPAQCIDEIYNNNED